MQKTRRLDLEARVFKLELQAFLCVCEAVNTPRSIACHMMAVSGEWDQYLRLPACDTMSTTFPDDYLVTSAMRKNPRLPVTCDRRQSAVDNWFEAERLCEITNRKLSLYSRGKLPGYFTPEQEGRLSRTIDIIASVLGDLSLDDLDFCEQQFRFGPGSTSSCSGSDVNHSKKIVANFAMTPKLYPYWRALLPRPWSECVHSISIESANRVTFVEKDATKDRAIAIEPHGNIFVQLGIGALLRRKLRQAGLDITTQASRNGYLASMAQRKGLSTIDLSMASDTLSYETVKLLLPPRWFALLDLARCEYSTLDGKEYRLEKFSSMGNGFTFELETLVFWALARASGDPDAVSFGDDIIIKRACAPALIQSLEDLGFQVNKSKTFLAGSFFESCGEDYWHGRNVRPFFFRGSYEDFHTAVIHNANLLRRYSHRILNGLGCDKRFLIPWLRVISNSTVARKTGIPITAGDSGLIRNFDEFTPSFTSCAGIPRYIGVSWRGRPVKARMHTFGCYVLALRRSTPSIDPYLEYQRGLVTRPKLVRQLCEEWANLGPWV